MAYHVTYKNACGYNEICIAYGKAKLVKNAPFGISIEPSATPFSTLHKKKFFSSVSLSDSTKGAATGQKKY